MSSRFAEGRIRPLADTSDVLRLLTREEQKEASDSSTSVRMKKAREATGPLKKKAKVHGERCMRRQSVRSKHVERRTFHRRGRYCAKIFAGAHAYGVAAHAQALREKVLLQVVTFDQGDAVVPSLPRTTAV